MLRPGAVIWPSATVNWSAGTPSTGAARSSSFCLSCSAATASTSDCRKETALSVCTQSRMPLSVSTVETQVMSSGRTPRKPSASAQPSTLQVFEPVPVSTVGASSVTVPSG